MNGICYEWYSSFMFVTSLGYNYPVDMKIVDYEHYYASISYTIMHFFSRCTAQSYIDFLRGTNGVNV